ncbi:MAG TPA: UTP--glucose-1-phosphate uridylyltransferase GalU [Acidimicrobiales bacterium]|jgi:UTP--glucose-1-phosphate uridylyltransferase|nr:UTP--glucose-1-phosphate uridylyltransferase GalU [Acidimicrobiales bacterium]
MASSVRKAVIPAAGMGTRFLPATKAVPKEMIPLVDKPAIQYVVEEAVSVGITDILIITGRGKHDIEDHFDRSVELEELLRQGGKEAELSAIRAISGMADIHFIRQGEPRGLGHAVGMARRHVGDEPFVVMLGDDLMHPKSGILAGMLVAHERTGGSVLCLRKVDRRETAMYGVVEAQPVSENLVQVTGLVEKPHPDEAPSDLGVLGRYVLTPGIFEAIAATKPGRGGEIQLTDAIMGLTASEKVFGHVFADGRFDVGNKLDYLKAMVHFALERDDLGPVFRAFLQDVVRPA